jgi:hypothetical protein
MADKYPNSGTLFRLPPENRQTDKSPEYEGEFDVDCPHCNGNLKGWVKAWIREGKTGKFFSLAFKFRQKTP